jgi:hypothetical protein
VGKEGKGYNIFAFKVPTHCPLFLQVKVGWKQGKRWEVKESALGSGFFEMSNRGKIKSILTEL